MSNKQEAYKERQRRRKARQKQNYYWQFTLQPGDVGFNRQVNRVMRERGLFYNDLLKTNCNGEPFAHTETAAFLAGPETPINRLLVIHRTGSGKTFAMIHILDSYFSDPRAKVVIFPNQQVVRNFYEKIKRTPNTYSNFVEARAQQARRANTMVYFRDTLAMTGELSKKGQLNELASPLRSITYSQAGGRNVFPRNGGRPVLPIFRIGYTGNNPFDNKIILMDEVHNLIKPPKGTDKQLATRLQRLREALFTAKGSVIVGLTATPFISDEKDGTDLLTMIKGREYAGSPTNEGFISYFNTLPTSIYPQVKPGPNLINVGYVDIEGENWKKYKRKEKERGKLSSNPDMRKMQLFRLMNYCNMAGYYTQGRSADFRRRLKQDVRSYATKLAYLVDECLNPRKKLQKCAILIDRRLGLTALESVVKVMDPKNTGKWAFVNRPNTEKERLENKTLELFNSKENIKGQKIRCLVLDAESFGEGIDLLGVRYFYLANPAPDYKTYKQWEGRVLRACGYTDLPTFQRNVTMEIVIGRGPEGSAETADQILYKEMKKETNEMEQAMQRIFGKNASDKVVLGL